MSWDSDVWISYLQQKYITVNKMASPNPWWGFNKNLPWRVFSNNQNRSIVHFWMAKERFLVAGNVSRHESLSGKVSRAAWSTFIRGSGIRSCAQHLPMWQNQQAARSLGFLGVACCRQAIFSFTGDFCHKLFLRFPSSLFLRSRLLSVGLKLR